MKKAPFSHELEAQIIHCYRQFRSPYKVAQTLNLNVDDVWAFLDRSKEVLNARAERHGGYGRPRLQRFIVARKRVSSEWDNDSKDISQARRDFEAGRVDLCTGRDGVWEILYAIPRRRISPRPNYFQQERVR